MKPTHSQPPMAGEASSHSPRLLSLDVYRGLIIAAMILVTDPGTYRAIYWPLRHADWDHPTPTDMIVPAFLLMAGVAITFSLSSRLARGMSRAALFLHILRRTGLLLVLGLVLNGFPDYDLHNLRLPGILQRIAICYLCGSVLYLLAAGRTSSRRIIYETLVLLSLLIGYWAMLKLIPVPGFGAGRLDSFGSLPAYVDRAVFGSPHLWPYGTTPGQGVTFDPEGLLSTLPALATLLIGMLAGDWLRTNRTQRAKLIGLIAAGTALVLAGLLLSPGMPLIKKIWTSTFAIYSGGITLLGFAFFYWLIDIKRWHRALTPLLILGTNAIFAFTLSTVITTLLNHIHVHDATGAQIGLFEGIYEEAFATWLPATAGSLAYALVIVTLNILLVYPLYRRRIFLKL